MNYFLTRGGRRYGHALFLGVILSLAFHTTGQAEAMKLEAKAGQLNTSRVEIMMQNSFPNQQSVTLKVDVAPSAMDNTAPPQVNRTSSFPYEHRNPDATLFPPMPRSMKRVSSD